MGRPPLRFFVNLNYLQCGVVWSWPPPALPTKLISFNLFKVILISRHVSSGYDFISNSIKTSTNSAMPIRLLTRVGRNSNHMHISNTCTAVRTCWCRQKDMLLWTEAIIGATHICCRWVIPQIEVIKHFYFFLRKASILTELQRC